MSASAPTPPAAGTPIAAQPERVRAAFMTGVYLRLLAGIALFIALEYALFASGLALEIARLVMSTTWLLILGGFMVVSWLATRLASRATSPGAAWGGYVLLVAANALLFATPLVLATQVEGAVSTAAWLSGAAFAGLSAVAILTGKDFSFLRGIVGWGMVLALVAIVGATIFGAQLGTWFAVAMIGLAGAAILWDTQRIYRTYPPGTEVVAAMQLFSSLALLFWYVLQLVMRR